MKVQVSRALVSVSDKSGLIDFCRGLRELGVEILSTGGSAKLLSEQGISVMEVSQYTGFPEMMDGRVKTLHPKIHGGILGRRGIDDQVMDQHDIDPIDLVVVNLYPFEQTIAKPDCNLDMAKENIDIGGPAMIRAAAKNFAAVAVLVDPSDYDSVLTELKQNQGAISQETRFRLATEAFAHTAHYDSVIAAYLKKEDLSPKFPAKINVNMELSQMLRYGENPHQKAAFYTDISLRPGSIAAAKQLHGKELSYNNIADADAALECVKSFDSEPTCVIVKHANPCGIAQADSLLAAYDRAYATDPTSAFGGIIAFNQELDAETASAIIERQFVEVLIAPAISKAALNVLAVKQNVRVLECGQWSNSVEPEWDYKRVRSGFLVQDRDEGRVGRSEIRVVTERPPSEKEFVDLLFAWKTVKFVKSNAIVYCKNRQTIGIGAGQMSRVYSARIAGIKAADEGLVVKGSVMASDAFFPFRDGIDAAGDAGITAVIQPGGSVRDDEIITAANEHNIAMVFTGMRHFRH